MAYPLGVHQRVWFQLMQPASFDQAGGVLKVITFLKRMIVLESKLKLVMYPHPKHVDKRLSKWEQRKLWSPNTHLLLHMLEVMESPKLGAQSSAVEALWAFCSMSLVTWCSAHGWSGILLSQWANRGWKAGTELRHLVYYLLGCNRVWIIEVTLIDQTSCARHLQIQIEHLTTAHVRVFLHAAFWWTIVFLSSGSQNQDLIPLCSAEDLCSNPRRLWCALSFTMFGISSWSFNLWLGFTPNPTNNE